MKKIIAGFVALAALSSVAFAEIKLSFYNKLYEEDYFWSKAGDETFTDFPALKERMFAEVKSDRVDAMVKATFALDDYDEKHFGLQGNVNDWYIEFRPIEIITLGLHDNINSEGSYLPIYDDNLQGGNIGSDGFTVAVRPNAFNKALRVALTAPFSFDGSDEGINYINGKKEDNEDENFHIGAGFIFSIPQIELGATFKNIPCSDHRVIGVSVALPTLFGVNEGLNLRVGFTHAEDSSAGFDDLLTDDFGVTGENILNAAVTFDKDALHLAAESVYTLKDDYDIYDLYAGLSFGYDVNEKLGVGLTGKILTDLNSDTEADNAYEVSVNADYSINDNNTVGVEFGYFTTKVGSDDVAGIKIPVYWKYHFDN